MDVTISHPEQRTSPLWMLWVGRVLSALTILVMVASGAAKLAHPASVVEQFVGKFGYSESLLTGIGILELCCAVIYAIPRTKILGAVLVTGYFGGAIATHLRAGEPVVVPLMIGIIAWAGVYLRDERLRALNPLRA
jgi:hypothetical protein